MQWSESDTSEQNKIKHPLGLFTLKAKLTTIHGKGRPT